MMDGRGRVTKQARQREPAQGIRLINRDAPISAGV
ncbi:hypothetical protein Mnod_1325 [Methylobacterium nodulans ORS 2060]|uniref:Uncharacterized protein n=1 Tax=Methylobacterium nodulans (strain LMG 21967 / CNCM I-2342 / ORS 2060) TaxID=460265 RepID=B8ILY1_METNO|nr:hypothetical protein Mnod_1325 [Methylobacterium nodulans ORS 2060]